jgi:hypothetical protein
MEPTETKEEHLVAFILTILDHQVTIENYYFVAILDSKMKVVDSSTHQLLSKSCQMNSNKSYAALLPEYTAPIT